MPRESHQNEAGRSHRPVAFYLRSSRYIALTKIHFKYFLGLEIHACNNPRLTNQKCNYILGT